MKKYLFLLIALITITAAAFIVYPSFATLEGFSAGNIINDFTMSNSDSMTEAEINSFLHSKNRCNDPESSHTKYANHSYHIENGHFVCMADETFSGSYYYTDNSGVEHHRVLENASAAHVLYQIGQDFYINPQVLIVLLQKEMSLITDTWPASWQYDKATGYGCPDHAPCNTEYYGFVNQLSLAARLFHKVLIGAWSSNYPAYQTVDVPYNFVAGCTSSKVYIENRATSALYRYTPYQPNEAALNWSKDSCSAFGNRNFYHYFTEWFGSTQTTEVKKPEASTSNEPQIIDGIYVVASVINSDQVFDLSGSNPNSGANIQLWTHNDTDAQHWKFTHIADGYYEIESISSGLVLDVDASGTKNGTNIQQWEKNETAAQRFKVVKNGDNIYSIEAKCNGKYLDIDGSNMASGTNIQVWSYNNTDAQKFKLILVEPESSSEPEPEKPTQVVSDGTYTIISSLSDNKVIDLSGSNPNSGANIQLWTHNDTDAQHWKFTHIADDYYEIENVGSGKVLDVDASGTENGTNIQQWEKNETDAQRFKVIKNEDGTYSLESKCSGKYMDVSASGIADGTNIQIWESNSTDAQKFKLVKQDN